MKIAICYSGFIINSEYCLESHKLFFQNMFDKSKDEIDVFLYTTFDESVENLNKKTVIEHKDNLEKYFKNNINLKINKVNSVIEERTSLRKISHFRDLVINYIESKSSQKEWIEHNEAMRENYLQQIMGYKKVFSMIKDQYDIVIRIRPDIKFTEKSIIAIKKFKMKDIIENKNDTIYIPNFHSWGGVNDRFAIGSYELMGIYMNIIDSVKDDFEFFKNNKMNNPETIMKNFLKKRSIKIRDFNNAVRFNRVRLHGIEKNDADND